MKRMWLVSSLLLFATALGQDPKDCLPAGTQPDAKVTTVVAQPWPPVKGQQLVMDIEGTLGVDVTKGGKTELKVMVNGNKLFDPKTDTCQFTPDTFQCPAPAGDFQMVKSFFIPKLAPDGDYVISISSMDQKQNYLFCVAVEWKSGGRANDLPVMQRLLTATQVPAASAPYLQTSLVPEMLYHQTELVPEMLYHQTALDTAALAKFDNAEVDYLETQLIPEVMALYDPPTPTKACPAKDQSFLITTAKSSTRDDAWHKMISDCATESFGQQKGTTKCIQKQTKSSLSPDCAACFGADVGCASKNCAMQCISDPTGKACIDCATKHCEPGLSKCTGLSGSDLPK